MKNQFISQSEIHEIASAGHVASPAQVQALIREIEFAHKLIESAKSGNNEFEDEFKGRE